MNTQALVELNSVKAFLFQNVANRKSQMLSLFFVKTEKKIYPFSLVSIFLQTLFCYFVIYFDLRNFYSNVITSSADSSKNSFISSFSKSIDSGFLWLYVFFETHTYRWREQTKSIARNQWMSNQKSLYHLPVFPEVRIQSFCVW